VTGFRDHVIEVITIDNPPSILHRPTVLNDFFMLLMIALPVDLHVRRQPTDNEYIVMNVRMPGPSSLFYAAANTGANGIRS
jgi:hypothetical protein